MTFVGYKPGSKAYRLWNPQTHKVIVSSDVTFNEQTFLHCPVPKLETPVTKEELHVLHPQPEGKQVQFIKVPALVFKPGDYQPTNPRKGTKCPPSIPLPPSRPDTPIQDNWR